MFREKEKEKVKEKEKEKEKHPEALDLLLEMKKEFNETDFFPLKQTCLRTVDSLLSVIEGVTKVDGEALKNAAFLDDPKRGNPIIKALFSMGVSLTERDLKFIESFNKEAFEFIKDKLNTNVLKPNN